MLSEIHLEKHIRPIYNRRPIIYTSHDFLGYYYEDPSGHKVRPSFSNLPEKVKACVRFFSWIYADIDFQEKIKSLFSIPLRPSPLAPDETRQIIINDKLDRHPGDGKLRIAKQVLQPNLTSPLFTEELKDENRQALRTDYPTKEPHMVLTLITQKSGGEFLHGWITAFGVQALDEYRTSLTTHSPSLQPPH